MRIAVDCRFIGKSGIGTYIENVVQTMLQSYPEHTFLLISDNKSFCPRQQNVSVQYVDISPFTLKELFLFPCGDINKCDVFFTPYINVPLGIKCPIYSTIHDVIFLDLPGLVSPLGKMIRKFYFWNAYRLSTKVFTVSEFSKSRIEYHFGDRRDVVVTYSGISGQLKSFEPEYDKKDDYFIYVGNVKKHKGLRTLVTAFSQAKQSGLTSKLLIVGDYSKFRSSEQDLDALINSNKDIEFTGFVDNSRLFDLISRAKALVLPSFYEGLGLPPMEALYLGTNAIISDIDVFKEIYNNMPVTFFPTGDASKLAEILLSMQPTPFDLEKLRNFVDSRYNFTIITKRILETITSHDNH